MIRAILLVCIFSLSQGLQAQIGGKYQSYEFYMGVGSSHYFGEVGGASGTFRGLPAVVDNLGLDYENSRLNGTLGLRFEFRKDMAIRAGLHGVWIAGNDRWSANQKRGYAFDAILFGVVADYEYYLAQRMTGTAPYLSAGLGAFVYRWKLQNSNQWTRLLYTPAVRFGIGTRLPSRGKLTHSVQVNFNYLISDFVDGINGARDIGDTFYTLSYVLNFELDKNFLYDHRGLIK